MKKFILKLDLEGDDKEKQRRALKTVAALSGIDEIAIDTKGKKLTVIGTVDPVSIVTKLRKKDWQASIIFVGPAKEPEKKEEPKKDEGKKDEAGKEEPKKEDEAKKDDSKKEDPKKDEPKKIEPERFIIPAMPYRQYYPPPNTYYYVNHSIEENPNSCTIC